MLSHVAVWTYVMDHVVSCYCCHTLLSMLAFCWYYLELILVITWCCSSLMLILLYIVGILSDHNDAVSLIIDVVDHFLRHVLLVAQMDVDHVSLGPFDRRVIWIGEVQTKTIRQREITRSNWCFSITLSFQKMHSIKVTQPGTTHIMKKFTTSS